jgi:hypothetical protein
MPIQFSELVGPGGLAGARSIFERLVIQLVNIKHRALSILAKPGDWGIDAYVGDLEGVISVWQAKYFPDGIGESQKGEIRSSFKAAIRASKEQGHAIDAWTLVVPTDLDGPAQQWWDGWKKRTGRKTGITIDIWTATTLEGMLLSDEARHLARHFFPNSMGVPPSPPSPTVHALPQQHRYDDALFVKQLEEAQITENESAKRQFFNHEVLAREVSEKEDPEEMRALTATIADSHAIWETRFNSSPTEPDGRKPTLHPDVMQAIEEQHRTSPIHRPPMGLVHRMGGMHRIVENGEAGWVAHFRDLVKAHRG